MYKVMKILTFALLASNFAGLQSAAPLPDADDDNASKEEKTVVYAGAKRKSDDDAENNTRSPFRVPKGKKLIDITHEGQKRRRCSLALIGRRVLHNLQGASAQAPTAAHPTTVTSILPMPLVFIICQKIITEHMVEAEASTAHAHARQAAQEIYALLTFFDPVHGHAIFDNNYAYIVSRVLPELSLTSGAPSSPLTMIMSNLEHAIILDLPHKTQICFDAVRSLNPYQQLAGLTSTIQNNFVKFAILHANPRALNQLIALLESTKGGRSFLNTILLADTLFIQALQSGSHELIAISYDLYEQYVMPDKVKGCQARGRSLTDLKNISQCSTYITDFVYQFLKYCLKNPGNIKCEQMLAQLQKKYLSNREYRDNVYSMSLFIKDMPAITYLKPLMGR